MDAMKPGISHDELLALLAPLGGVRDAEDRWDLTVVVAADRLREALTLLRDGATTRFDVLLDIAGVDYLSHARHQGPRFAVVYVLKSTAFRHRLRLKVQVDEEAPQVPSVHDLFKIADWAERETWDQYGIVFAGHPNLKRLLNHHEFVGHPLRKDYPCQKRQTLSLNDPMIDQLEARLRQQGYEIVQSDAVSPGAPLIPHKATP
jgi:NADH/F420H2 dehydrogenase subunit C